MKYKISKTEFNALSEDQKKLYTANGEDFVIKIDGMPDVGALETAVASLTEKVNASEAEKAKIKAAADKAAADKSAADLEAQRKSGNFAAIEEDYKRQIKELKDGNKATLDKHQGEIRKLTVDAKIDELAAKLGGPNAELLRPVIEKRLTLEGDIDNGFIVRVMKDGKPSGLSVDDLEKEIRAEEKYKAVLVAPQSSGSGSKETFGQPANTPAVKDNPDATPRERQSARALEIASSIE